MFTWICPKCGREVPPSYDECPDCTPKAQAGAEPQASVPPPSPPPGYPPPQAVRPSGPVAPPPITQALQDAMVPPLPPRPAPHALPTWLMTIIFIFAFVGLGATAYWGIGYLRGRTSAAPSAIVENPAAKPGAKTNPLQKYIEVSGVRFNEDRKTKQPMVNVVVTNHSGAEIAGLQGNVTVWGRTQKSEEEAAGSFAFSANLGPFESKDIIVPLTTKLKMYELPDWQNVSTDVQITAPAGVLGQ